MEKHKLSTYSRRFLDFLLARHPEWEQHCKIEEDSSDGPRVLVVEIRAPNPAAETPLMICTCNEEITVSFGMAHTHFNAYADDSEPDEFANAVDFVDRVLSDEVKAAWWLRQGKWAGSMWIEGNEEADSSHLREKPDRFVVRSWSGSDDTEKDLTSGWNGSRRGGTADARTVQRRDNEPREE